jgi:uncharacterized protein DUF2442
MLAALHDVTDVQVLGRYRLRLTFPDSLVGDVDLSHLHGRGGVFESLRDPEYFGQVHVDPEIGRITWLSGVDLAPEVLYERASAHPVATSRQATG